MEAEPMEAGVAADELRRVELTDAAANLLRQLTGQHGPLMFHQSGGCCDGSSPMCFPDGEFLTGDADILLGELAVPGLDRPVPFWMSVSQYEYWKHTHLTVDVVPGRGSGLDRLGGSEFADIPLRAMSKGMCQKVAVAQALLPRPGLLILDEAWTGLDAAARVALDGVVAERIGDGGAVVFVDHDQRRLDEQRPERWQVKGGQVSVVAQAQAQAQARSAGAAGAGPSILIELTGY